MAGSTWIDSVNAAYPAMARLYDGHEANKAAADQGYYVKSGCDVVAGTTTGTLKVNTGTIFSGTTEVNITTALDNIACASLADTTYDRWGILEVDNTTTPNTPTANLNLGTAAASPVMPSLTANRSAHAWIYIPANATAVDNLTSSANGKAKIIDARQLRTGAVPRNMFADTSGTQTFANTPATLQTIVNGNSPFVIPGNSLSVGDIITIDASFTVRFHSNSQYELVVLVGSGTVLDFTTATTYALDAINYHRANFRAELTCTAIGASATFYINANGSFGDKTGATTPALEWFTNGSSLSATFDSRSNANLDIQGKIVTYNASSNTIFRSLRITKFPVV